MSALIFDICAGVVLAVIIALAVALIVKKARKGGGCCGEHEAAEKSSPAGDGNKAHYPYSLEMKIDGMTCANCARRVENALNSLDGVMAKVSKDTDSARIYTKTQPDVRLLCGAVAKAGYMARPE